MYPSAYPWTGLYPHHPAYNNNNPTQMHHFAPGDNQKPPKEIPSPPTIMKMDPAGTLTSPYQEVQQPWPYGGISTYCFPPVPHEYHHGGPYTSRPPYFPHYPPPPPFQSYGLYPPFPAPYPASYSVPPPHYSIEQPRYDYDKNNQAPHRCCGCSHREDDNKLKIQPQEPQLEKKANDSLASFLFKDCPCPIMWVPPGYMKRESKTTDKDKDSPDPVSLKPSKAVENGELARDQHDGDAKGFPFPIFWLPSKNREMGKDPKENNNLDQESHKGPDEKIRETRENDDGLGSEAESETGTKHVVKKVIPVKQLGTDEEKKSLKRIETKAKSDSPKKAETGTEGKGSPNTTKLPPVCLRIDPLPRKKKSSRSPSPPADKERSKGLPVDSSQQQRQLSEDLKKNKEEQSKGKIKTIEVTSAANKVVKDSVADHGFNVQRGEENGSQKVMAQGQSSKDEPYRLEVKKKNMSVNEAALIIQSVYRGFEVRKSQSLMKLRQISEVRKQVVELRNRIQDLVSSSTTFINDKQKLIIGETIMSLLLKLDTIQGLHPIVRDIRKSVAKELVVLQEKLDSLSFSTYEAPIEETMSSTELVMRPEHVSIQEEESGQSDGNVKLVESEAAESHNDDGAEAYSVNPETQLEVHNGKPEEGTNNQLQVSMETKQSVDNAIQEKFDKDQVPADNIDAEVELDTCISENHEAEATDSLHEAQGIKPEKLVEENTEELKDNQFQMSEQPATQEKSDQLQADPDNDVEIMESNASVFDNREVEVMESEKDGGTKASDIKLAPEMEPQSIIEELNDTQLQMSQIEHPVGQVMFDQTPAQFDGDVKNVESSEHPRVEATEFLDDGNVQTLDRDVSMVEMKVEVPKKDAVNGIQEDYVVAREEAPKADDVESSTEGIPEDLGGASPVLPTRSQDGKVMKDLGENLQVSPVGDGDRKLMEENEKLRMVVEELMKAGNEQLSVIRELTGRVKDMEKKLCKKKKKMKVKKCNSSGSRSRGFGVEDELIRDCL